MCPVRSDLKPPYYAVIFSSRRTTGDDGDAAMADRDDP
jgi:hypothetical protein